MAWSAFDPVVIDLDGDGLELIGLSRSSVLFDIDMDGSLELTGWVAPDDGMLVHDLNGNGLIDNLSELFSEQYSQEAETGFGALATLDENGDGVFDSLDSAFSDVRIWKDINQNGISEQDELHTLESLGIESIDVANVSNTDQLIDGNRILRRTSVSGTGAFENGEGAADVAFMALTADMTRIGNINGITQYKSEDDGSTLGIIEDDLDRPIDLETENLDTLFAGDGKELIVAKDIGSVIIAGGGDDTLCGGDGADILRGGIGADSLSGGSGNDILFADADDVFIDGGSGEDSVYFDGDSGVSLDLGTCGIEKAVGGGGDDTLVTSGSTSVFIDGMAGNDSIQGGAGDDLLAGAQGNDSIDGGAGIDIVAYSGNQGDYAITDNSDGTITVTDTTGEDGIDIIQNVERLVFADSTLHMDDSNNTPWTVDDSFEWWANVPITISASDLLENDLDFDADILHIYTIGNAVGGSVNLNDDEDIIFTPDEGFLGSASFEYSITDGHGARAQATAKITIRQNAPSDTYYDLQHTYLSLVGVTSVWDEYTGDGVIVGINDQGVETDHPDLVNNYNLYIDYDYTSGDGDPSPEGGEFHGTLVAGIIGAERNGIGVVGVAYDSTITAFRGIGGLAGQENVDVSNNSWNTSIYDENEDGVEERRLKGTLFSPEGVDDYIQSGLETAVTQGRDGKGTAVVASAGNSRESGLNTDYLELSNSRKATVVGAIGTDLKVASFSTPGAAILVSAPGEGIVTTDMQGDAGIEDGTVFGFDPDYAGGAGTSASAPIVSGVIALMLEANPDLGWRDVQEILAYSAWNTDPDHDGWQVNGATNWNGGGLEVSHDYGYGMVNAWTAVRLAETWGATSTSANEVMVEASSTPGFTITDNDATGISDTISMAQGVEIDHVEVTLNISHNNIGDLEVYLTSPDGTQSILLERPEKAPDDPDDTGSSCNDIHWTFYSSHHWGEVGIGDWILTVKDCNTGVEGTLDSWILKLYGDAITSDDRYVYTADYGKFTGEEHVARRILSDSDGIDTINASPVFTDTFIDLESGANSWVAENTLTIEAGTVIENAITGVGDDILRGNSAANQLSGGQGDDQIQGFGGADTLDGGAGKDLLVYSESDAGVTVDLTAGSGVGGHAEGDVFTDFESVTGSDYADSITGDTGDNFLNGGAGADTLVGGNGDDEFVGGDGDDVMQGDAGEDTFMGMGGNDSMDGGTDFDTAVYAGLMADYTVTTVDDLTTVVGLDGTDILTGIEFLRFSDGTMSLTGNTDPTATSFSRTVLEDTEVTLTLADILANASDIDGDPLTLTGVGSPEHGSVSINASGDVVFTPETDYTGSASFSYTVSDGMGGEASATVTVSVTPENDAPVTIDSVVAIPTDQAVNGQLLASDSENPMMELTFSLDVQAANGTATVNGDGSFSYQPNTGYIGEDVFTYTVTDPSGSQTAGEPIACLHNVEGVIPKNFLHYNQDSVH